MPCDGGKSGYGGGVGTLEAVPLALICWNLIVFPAASLSTHLLPENADWHTCHILWAAQGRGHAAYRLDSPRNAAIVFLWFAQAPDVSKGEGPEILFRAHGMGKQSRDEASIRD
jgi:hypothetical protein